MRNSKQTGLWMPYAGMAVGRPTLSKEFLKDNKKLAFLIFMSRLFHSYMVDVK